MEIIIYDTEFTSWEGAVDNNWKEDWQYREIIQIGAIKFDTEKMIELDSFDTLVKPVKNPKLSKYLMELTGITQISIDKEGVDFIEGYNKFKQFIGNLEIFSYGGDHKIIQENLMLNHVNKNFIGNDIKPWFEKRGIPEDINSGAIAGFLNIDIKVKEHNALEDVRSIIAGFIKFMNNGVKNPFTKEFKENIK